MGGGAVGRGESVAIRKALTEKKLFKKDGESGRSRVATVDIYALAWWCSCRYRQISHSYLYLNDRVLDNDERAAFCLLVICMENGRRVFASKMLPIM
jgi:hypothetical protein